MSKIDELFDKKKDEAPMLDLSKTVINTAEEYRAVLDKVPDFKTRPEKVRSEDLKIKEDNKTKTPKKEIKAYETLGTRGYEEKHFTFMDPIPVEMKRLKFEELCIVPIEWRMLTSIRPKLKMDEEFFDRLVGLGKSELKTKAKDKRDYAKNTMFRKTKNRSGVTETRIISCAECGEEYCNGKQCAITNYDMFARMKVEVETKARVQAAPTQGVGKMKKLRKRPKRKPRSKSAAPELNKGQRNKSGAKSKQCAITNYDMFARMKVEVETKARVQAAPTQGVGKMKKLRKRPKRKPRSKSAAPELNKGQRNKSGAKSDSEL